MSSQLSDWYRDPDALVTELQRGRRVPAPAPSIAGFDEMREIRRGGQGVVYSAIQRSTKRQVAVKVLLEGAFSSASARRRFEREVDLVAGLRHPNIVSIFDSGVTPDGRLYFVMEYIDGLPLDGYLRGSEKSKNPKLETKGLLALFAEVCDAVNYAHQRGVIHRDLKPGNILVDAAGRPHVCDFGLAKTIVDSDDPAMRSMSMTGQFMGSLPWASPEQLEAAPGVDVRTDVYSLGVVLYQISTGRFPYDVSGGIRKLFDNISGVQPVRPSTINRHLDDEIDTIVMKCLAKDPQRRYQSAAELVDDIHHYLAGEPIQAKRDSAWYALRKTLHRYQLAGLVTAVILIAATAALMVSLRSWRDATRARDEARQESVERAAIGAFLEHMMTSPDPARDGRDVRFMDVLDKAAAEVGTTLLAQPRVEAEVRRTLGSTYAALGMYELAEKQLQAARSIASRVLGPQHRTTLELVAATPEIVAARGRLDEAEQQARSALADIRGALGESDVLTLRMKGRLGDILMTRGKTSEAEDLLRASLEQQRQILGTSHADTQTTMNALAVLLKQSGRYAEAETLFRHAVQEGLDHAGPNDPGVLNMRSNLAMLLQSQGKLDEAEVMQRQCLESRTRVLGEEHPETVLNMSNLATLLLERRKLDEAERLLRKMVEIDTRVLGPDHPATLTGQNNLGKALQDSGQFKEAEQYLRMAFEARRRVLGPQHAHTLLTQANLAALLGATGRADQAVSLLREVIDARQRTLGDDHLDTMVSKNNLGLLLQKSGKMDEALELFAAVCASADRALPAQQYIGALFRGNYGRCLMAQSRMPEAEQQLTESCSVLVAALGSNDQRTQQNMKSLGDLYERTGQSEKAVEWRAKLTAVTTTSSQPSAPAH